MKDIKNRKPINDLHPLHKCLKNLRIIVLPALFLLIYTKKTGLALGGVVWIIISQLGSDCKGIIWLL